MLRFRACEFYTFHILNIEMVHFNHRYRWIEILAAPIVLQLCSFYYTDELRRTPRRLKASFQTYRLERQFLFIFVLTETSTSKSKLTDIKYNSLMVTWACAVSLPDRSVIPDRTLPVPPVSVFLIYLLSCKKKPNQTKKTNSILVSVDKNVICLPEISMLRLLVMEMIHGNYTKQTKKLNLHFLQPKCSHSLVLSTRLLLQADLYPSTHLLFSQDTETKQSFGVWEKHFVQLSSVQLFVSTKVTQKMECKFVPLKLKFGTDT